MKTLKLFSLLVLANLALCNFTNAASASCYASKSSCNLETAMAHRTLKNGDNLVAITRSGARVYAVVADGKQTWQVRDASGKVLQSDVRKAQNPDNLRIWFQPAQGSSLFVEAPASVIQP